MFFGKIFPFVLVYCVLYVITFIAAIAASRQLPHVVTKKHLFIIFTPIKLSHIDILNTFSKFLFKSFSSAFAKLISNVSCCCIWIAYFLSWIRWFTALDSRWIRAKLLISEGLLLLTFLKSWATFASRQIDQIYLLTTKKTWKTAPNYFQQKASLRPCSSSPESQIIFVIFQPEQTWWDKVFWTDCFHFFQSTCLFVRTNVQTFFCMSFFSIHPHLHRGHLNTLCRVLFSLRKHLGSLEFYHGNRLSQ